jgi:major membrane immunogen (membrane-anchored lipoprotein)
MKKAFLLTVMTTVLALTACNKSDDYVDASQLVGKWGYMNDDPRLAVDGTLTYTFDKDGGYKLVVYDILSDAQATHEGKYELSTDGRLITLHKDEDGDCSGQFFLLKLNSKEMRWKEAVDGAQPSEKRFIRVID